MMFIETNGELRNIVIIMSFY